MNRKRQALDVARNGHEHRRGTSGQVDTVGDRQHAAMIAQLEETTGALTAQPSESSSKGWVDSQLSAATRKNHDAWNFKHKAYMGQIRQRKSLWKCGRWMPKQEQFVALDFQDKMAIGMVLGAPSLVWQVTHQMG